MATIGLDIGRHSVKMVALEKTKEDFKIVDVGFRMVPEQNQAYDPERIDQPLWVMAVKELMRQQGIKPKRVRNLVTGINDVHAMIRSATARGRAHVIRRQPRAGTGPRGRCPTRRGCEWPSPRWHCFRLSG